MITLKRTIMQIVKNIHTKIFIANVLNTILNILNDILFESTNSVVLFHLVRAQKSIATRNY